MITCPVCETVPHRQFRTGPTVTVYCKCTRLACARHLPPSVPEERVLWFFKTGPLEESGEGHVLMVNEDGLSCSMLGSPSWTPVPPDEAEGLIDRLIEDALTASVLEM